MDTNGDFWGLDIFFINQSPIIVQCTVILLEMDIHYRIFWKNQICTSGYVQKSKYIRIYAHIF